jgi:hypothetical protein
MRNFSAKAFILIVLLLFFTQFYYSFAIYNNSGNLFSWDILGYYMYLPFTIIHHDPGITNQAVIDQIFKLYEPSNGLYQAFTIPNGNRIPGYTIGMTVLYFPFFLIAHAWALLTGYPADGFSFPYQFCISNGIMVYILAGVFYLRKLLLEFFSDRVAAIVLLLICLGTNYWQEVTHASLGVHPVLFSGYAILCYLLIRWYRQPSNIASILLGLTGGLMTMIRGSEVLLTLVVLLWEVDSSRKLKERFAFFVRHYRKILLVVIAAIIAFSPQLWHWKTVSGNWYFNNYQAAEGFNFSRPNLYNIFFSFKKSLFIYTPLMIFAILGFYHLYKRNRGLFIPVFIFFVVNTYLLSCWLLWWNATSFGLRYFVQSYALMSLPLAAFVRYLSGRSTVVKLVSVAGGIFLIFLNIFQTWQTHHKILHPERNTKAYYKAVFLKTSVPQGAQELLETDRNTTMDGKNFDESRFAARTIGFCDFENVNTITVNPAFIDSSFAWSPPSSCRLDPLQPFSPTYRIPYAQVTSKAFAWLRITLRYYCTEEIDKAPVSVVAHCELDGTGRKVDKYEALDFSTSRSVKNTWNQITFEYQLPYRFYDDEPVLVYVWYRGDSIPVYIDDFKVEAFEPKY